MAVGAIFFIQGALIAALAVLAFLPFLAALSEGDTTGAFVFLASAGLYAFFGGGMVLGLREVQRRAGKREALLILVLSWVLPSAFAAVPFYALGATPSLTAAYFEAVSGWTTTGATAIADVGDQSRAILLWRALLEWAGGLWALVMAMSILATFGIGGLHAEQRQGERRTLWRYILRTARRLGGIYAVFTLACFIGLWVCGIPRFDALCHSFSTVSTGGFSTRDASLGAFDAPSAELVAVVFMIIGALNGAAYVSLARGDWRLWRQNAEVRYFVTGIGLVATVIFGVLLAEGLPPAVSARYALVNTTSLMTTTGLGTGTPSMPAFVTLLLLTVIFIGGCTASTAGGLKVLRLVLLLKQATAELHHLAHPHRIARLRYAGRVVPETQRTAALAYFATLVTTYALVAILLSADGLPFMTAMIAAGSSLSNVGPALPMLTAGAAHQAEFSAFAQWVVIGGMILGRVEVLALLALLNPAYWRG